VEARASDEPQRCCSGAKVLVADYNAESGERTVKTIREASGTAVFHPADVSNPQDVDALMHKGGREVRAARLRVQ
jgi:NAD(P)-dependent dehydrogenase (short-subunit alcohol dehydrogenase family)